MTDLTKESFAPGSRFIYTGDTDTIPDWCTILEVVEDSDNIWEMKLRIRHDDSGKEEVVESYLLEKELFTKRMVFELTFANEDAYEFFIRDLEWDKDTYLKERYLGLMRMRFKEEE